MRSKSEIEKTLAHMKADCTADPAVNAVWIAALEWVLGDEAHQQAYNHWLNTISHATEPPFHTTDEKFLSIIARELLTRLR